MISNLYYAVPMILSQVAAPGVAAAEPNPTQHVLTMIDRILSGVAVALAVIIGAYLLARPKRDPLRSAPLRPNRLREDALALAVVVYLLAAAFIAGLVQLFTGLTESIISTIVVGNGAHLAGIGVCLFIAATRFDGGIRRFLFAGGGLRRGWWGAATALLAIAAIGSCPILRDTTMRIILYFAPDHMFDPHPTIQALHEQTQPIGVIIALWGGAVVIAPIAEEFFFRGLLQTLLLRLVHRRWLSIVLASLAFGAVHFQQPHAMAALTVLALLIGYSYERTGSLVPPILIHAVFNLKTLIWDALGGVPP